jgi:hypothetical protein
MTRIIGGKRGSERLDAARAETAPPLGNALALGRAA